MLTGFSFYKLAFIYGRSSKVTQTLNNRIASEFSFVCEQ